MAEKLGVNGQETENIQAGNKSPLDLVLDEVLRIQALGAACLALAEKEDLPGQFTDLIELMMEQTDALEDKLDAWRAAPKVDRGLH